MSSPFLAPFTHHIENEITRRASVKLSVLRLDSMHPFVNGNKWYKLKYNLWEAQEKNYTTLLTFGGAYSNHIFATAAAAKLFNFRSIGVIRGEERLPLNSTLSFAKEQGMQIVYLNRDSYRKKQTRELQEDLKQRFGDPFIIPEGGSNLNGVRGCTEIVADAEEFDTICLACGTGTTLAGIALSLSHRQKVIGFPVLKKGEFLVPEIENLLSSYLISGLPKVHDSPGMWELICDYHFGGYAKVNEELIMFSKEFQQAHSIILDYVYTAKMFYGVMDLLQMGFFPEGDRILLLHTGGLQGNIGMEQRL
ncbi:pyridoxal-phosphate dependent enzyme [Nodularia harveyana UHCC-0300]|uniref:Pyridoxal-phosphate dependent enzyme n=1 Tax=Nodularia harveyana UHCC-0300 TaxID=2974287 RepID=A0ABU5UGA6_9CYAN|nr:pyridoxal-phosphate dependent enzyme [Nodularia harveyana]MEA5582545.1 pyridoxal-phosphate dependent enzyme [Nodularia harveyana UHCC-0300]